LIRRGRGRKLGRPDSRPGQGGRQRHAAQEAQYVLIGAAAAAVDEGDARTAALALGRVDALCDELEIEVEPFEREMADKARARTLAALGHRHSEQLVIEGHAMQDDRVRELLSRTEPPATRRPPRLSGATPDQPMGA
jgi:hypothetical protein